MKRFLAILTLLLVALPLLAQNPDFELRYKQATEMYNKGQYEKARTTIRNALNKLPDLSKDQKDAGNRLATKCDQAIADRDRLDLFLDYCKVGYESSRDSAKFAAGRPELVTASSSHPDWCKVEKVANGHVYISIAFNPDKTEREADITVKLGKIKTRNIHVKQDARPETVKQVVVSSTPERCHISVDGATPVTGTWKGSLPSGQHSIRIEKNGYAVKDTLINVLDDMRSDQVMEYTLNLQPQFARLKLDVIPEEGFDFGESPAQYTLNGILVDTTPREIFSYDDDRELQRYSMYKDGTIPVSPGWVDVVVSAPNFESQKASIQVQEGEFHPISVTLKAITGTVSLIDMGQARNAAVWLDGKPAGTVDSFTMRRVKIGDHLITLEREGYLSTESSYPFTLHEAETVSLNVAMVRYTPYLFTSTPTDAKVLVDGELIGNTPTKPYLFKEVEPGHVFHVVLQKDGYMDEERDILPDFASQDPTTLSFGLISTNKFTIKSDMGNLTVTVKNKRNGDTTFVKDVILPAQVAVPLSNKAYYVQLNRFGGGPVAYRGKRVFNNPDKAISIQSWSRNYFQILDANLFLFGNGNEKNLINLGEDPAKQYKAMGSVSLGSFRLFDGFSTSLAHASLFMGADKNASVLLPAKSGATEAFPVSNANYLPAFSVLFINDEFRVGGAIIDYLDVDLMASYAWYPDIVKYALPISHMTGHDVFVGLELSSRFPVANINFKAGMQMYPGLKANIYAKDNYLNKSDTKENFVTYSVQMPAMFVVSVGFSLGGMDSKGKNILRVF